MSARERILGRCSEQDRGYTTPCLIYGSYCNKKGYGQAADDEGRVRHVHRILWDEANGAPPDGYEPDHLCCQPACVRLDHMELVTHAENSRRSRTATTSLDQLRRVRRLREVGHSYTTIARAVGVSKTVVASIVTGKCWVGVE
jgi:hypothetical protein